MGYSRWVKWFSEFFIQPKVVKVCIRLKLYRISFIYCQKLVVKILSKKKKNLRNILVNILKQYQMINSNVSKVSSSPDRFVLYALVLLCHCFASHSQQQCYTMSPLTALYPLLLLGELCLSFDVILSFKSHIMNLNICGTHLCVQNSS